MNVDKAVEVSAVIVCLFYNKQPLQEFELLAYVQACRMLEVTLKDCRQIWEGVADEFGDST